MSKIKDSHNVLIPWGILSHKKFNSNDKVVYAYIKFRYQFFHHLGKPYRESNATIAKALHLSRTTVVKSIDKLCECRVLKKDANMGATNHYEILDNVVVTPHPVIEYLEDEENDIDPPF